MSILVRCFLAGLVPALLAGCVAPPRLATEQDIRALQRIDLVVDTPRTNYTYEGDPTLTLYVPYSPTVAPMTAMGLGLIVHGVISGIEHHRRRVPREGTDEIRHAVDDLDLRETAYRQLMLLRPEGVAAPEIALVEGGFPKGVNEIAPFVPGNKDVSERLAEAAKARSADATLFLALRPLIWTQQEGRTQFRALWWLYARDGRQIASAGMRFVGPEAPDLDVPGQIAWWREGAYRKVLMHGVRAAVWPLAQDLFQPSRTAAEAQRLAGRFEQLKPEEISAWRLVSSRCSVEREDAPVRYRFERDYFLTVAAAFCDGEKVEIGLTTMDAAGDRDMVQLTDPLPRLPQPVLRERPKVEAAASAPEAAAAPAQ